MRDSRRHPAHMIRLKPLPDEVAVLDQSHVFRGARLILGYVAEHGEIPLTPSKAFKRIFVNWAAEAFILAVLDCGGPLQRQQGAERI